MRRGHKRDSMPSERAVNGRDGVEDIITRHKAAAQIRTSRTAQPTRISSETDDKPPDSQTASLPASLQARIGVGGREERKKKLPTRDES